MKKSRPKKDPSDKTLLSEMEHSLTRAQSLIEEAEDFLSMISSPKYKKKAREVMFDFTTGLNT